jgi:hypothetical protein
MKSIFPYLCRPAKAALFYPENGKAGFYKILIKN